ncbi:MAG: 4Fe-4S cluster-binding domain-containing protein, partial [Bacteroidales bacterium]|nr:4Fe-4S cluster-binding domain-containing protein [Bacteroidales bacterium]
MDALEAPFIGINRHRIEVDGEGVTTLAAFHGCPLHCRYCLNPRCLDANARVLRHTPESL